MYVRIGPGLSGADLGDEPGVGVCLGQLEAGTVHADGHREHGAPGTGDVEEGRQTGP